MPVVRCSDQTILSLQEYYTAENLIQDQVMISIIDNLDGIFKETTIFGLTSIKHLNLLAHDSYKTNWFVTFIARNENEIYVEYLLPIKKQPWPFAKVTGEAKSINEGIKYIVKAMKESEGWPGNKEIEDFLRNKFI